MLNNYKHYTVTVLLCNDNYYTQMCKKALADISRSSAVAEGPRDVHVIVVMSSLNMCKMATNNFVLWCVRKVHFSGLQFTQLFSEVAPSQPAKTGAKTEFNAK